MPQLCRPAGAGAARPTLQAVFHWEDATMPTRLGLPGRGGGRGAVRRLVCRPAGVRLACGSPSRCGARRAWPTRWRRASSNSSPRGSHWRWDESSTPAGLKAATLYLPPAQRNVAIGLVNAASNIGAILTPLIIPPFALAFGWKAAPPRHRRAGLHLADRLDRRHPRPDPGGRRPNGRRSTGANCSPTAAAGLSCSPGARPTPSGGSCSTGCPISSPPVPRQGALGGPVAVIFGLAALGAVFSGALFPLLVARG